MTWLYRIVPLSKTARFSMIMTPACPRDFEGPTPLCTQVQSPATNSEFSFIMVSCKQTTSQVHVLSQV